MKIENFLHGIFMHIWFVLFKCRRGITYTKQYKNVLYYNLPCMRSFTGLLSNTSLSLFSRLLLFLILHTSLFLDLHSSKHGCNLQRYYNFAFAKFFFSYVLGILWGMNNEKRVL